VVAGWILFRANSFAQAANCLRAVVRVSDWFGFDWGGLNAVIDAEGWLAVIVGVLASTPLLRGLAERILVKKTDAGWRASYFGTAVIMSLLALSAMKLANSSFNPFIYYRF
jgi:hypothetical protein